ncbi:MAG: hypothetical protein RQ751_02225 [Longimicrobiales bacterium]|nr:hypothetical protein [Longimicrobiales bacterium]
MRRTAGVLLLAAALAGCPEPAADRPPANDRDTLTRRQRDSITATLPLPGAGAVGGALDAADAAAARAARHDSLLGGGR